MDDFDKLYVLLALDDLFKSIEAERAIDPGARLDHFKAAIKTATLRITAVRSVAAEVLDATDPSALEDIVAARATAADAARARGRVMGRAIVAAIDDRDARATLAALEADVQTATELVQRAAPGSSDLMLARAALRETERLRDEAAAKVRGGA